MHGFLLSRKTYTAIDFPNVTAGTTLVSSINNHGQIVGAYVAPNGFAQSFVLSR